MPCEDVETRREKIVMCLELPLQDQEPQRLADVRGWTYTESFFLELPGREQPWLAWSLRNSKTTDSAVLSYLLFSILSQFYAKAFRRRIASGWLRDSWSVVPLKGKIVSLFCMVASPTLPGTLAGFRMNIWSSAGSACCLTISRQKTRSSALSSFLPGILH